MEEETGQVPATEPQDDPIPTQQAEPPAQEPVEEPFDKDRAMRTIQTLRAAEKEGKAAKAALAEYQKREQEAKDKDLSEQQRLSKTLQQREAELEFERQTRRDQANQHAVERQAAKLGIVDPEAAVKLLDWSSLEYDEDGKPQDVEMALEELVKAKPYLVGRQEPKANGNPTNPATRQSASGTRRFTAAQIQDRAFYLANKAEIMRAIQEGRYDP
jgi:hypothetical protein